MRVEVQDDGSLHVTEQLTFDFDGYFSGAYRDIPLAEGVKARNVVVSEDGEEYEPGGATGLGSYDRPGTFGAEQLEITEPEGGPTRGLPGRLALRGGVRGSRRSRSATTSPASWTPTTT